MMKSNLKTTFFPAADCLIKITILFTVILVLDSCDQALDTVINVSGIWTGTATNFIDTGNGTTEININIAQIDELLSGVLTTESGSSYPFSGSILRGEIFFIWRNLEEGVDLRFTGLLTGRTISGTWRMGDLKTFETLHNGQWSVTRGS